MTVFAFLMMFVVINTARSQLLSEVLKEQLNLITFSNLLARANLTHVLDQGKYIVFGASDDAFNYLGQTGLDRLFDINHRDELTNILKYHIAPWSDDDIPTDWSEEFLPTLTNSTLRVISYPDRNMTLVNGAKAKELNFTVTNGHLFVLDSVLQAPKNDIYSLLKADQRFSMFLTMAALSGRIQELKENDITVFAPVNNGLNIFPTSDQARFISDMNAARAIVDMHIFNGTYYSQAMYDGEHFQSLHGNTVRLAVGGYNKWFTLHPGTALLQTQDWLATNGVIHIVENLLLRSHHYWPVIG